jgi:ABC-type multidrug transport system fused ATPase/permease subunit
MLDYNIISEEQINSICANIPDIEKMENLRLKVRKRRKNFILVLVIALITLIIAFVVVNHKSFAASSGIQVVMIAAVIAVILLLIFYAVYISPPLNRLKSYFNQNIIAHYIQSILPGAQYEPENYHSLQTYYESLLFMIDVDRHNGANYVHGMFDKTDVSFSYMHTEYKQVSHTKNGTKTTWHTIFKGIFMCADCNKKFSGKTLVLPDTAEKYLGGFGKWLQKKAGNTVGEMVYMENVHFEKEFVVYSTDPVEARYLITPKIQEQIFNMKKLLKKDLRLSFVNNNVFVAVNRENIFQLNTSLSFTSNDTLKYYMKDIVELLTLIHLLDLNIRIWGKL